MAKQRKMISFDISKDALAAAGFGGGKGVLDDWRGRLLAYQEIGRVMKELGFSHRQYSAYISKKPITTQEVAIVVASLDSRLPWLSSCVQKMDVTNIGKELDLTAELRQAAANRQNAQTLDTSAEVSVSAPTQEAPAAPARRSMEETRAAVAARKAASASPEHAPPTKSKTKGERGD